MAIIISSFIKFAILATCGELIALKITTNDWKIRGFNLGQRAFIWGILGIVLSFIMPIYSGGVELLISEKRLPAGDFFIIKAFYISLFMNLFFAFPMMVSHRITDALIDQNKLFSKWPIVQILKDINWDNMIRKVLPTIFWFWIPAHTLTFCLPSNFRILFAAFLSLCLGLILAYMKKKAM